MVVRCQHRAGKGIVAQGCALGKQPGSFYTHGSSKLMLGVVHHVVDGSSS